MRARILGLVLAAIPLLAHHSIRGTYDPKQPVTIQGVVVSFVYMNPHSYAEVDAKEVGGPVARWRIEIAAAAVLAGRGWTRDTVKTGDVVAVSGYRARIVETNRAVVGRFVLADGRELASWPSGTMWLNPTEAEFLSGK
jgi:hypothetical protein